MTKDGFYTSGEFAKKANVTLRTIRYYDRMGLLKPSKVGENNYRLYSEEDFAKLQKILSLKYLGFSLEEIMTMTLNDIGTDSMEDSIALQLSLVDKKVEHLKQVQEALRDTKERLHDGEEVDWAAMLPLLHISSMERALVEQYKNASNLDIRIGLHKMYSQNKEGWFSWLFCQCDLKSKQKILEIGCGTGELWKENKKNIPKNIQCVVSDKSQGMVEDAKDNIGEINGFVYEVMDGQQIPYPDNTFDRVIANHVLFYMEDISKALKEIYRILKPGGKLIASTYGEKHMKEMQDLIKEFDSRISLSQKSLYYEFGLENGKEMIEEFFSNIEIKRYDDSLFVDDPKPLISYIVSCHGNQQEYINKRYMDFRKFVEDKMREGAFHITKDAGCFIVEK